MEILWEVRCSKLADEYTDISQELILNRMLDRVLDKWDKREGSLIWDSLSPAAIELRLLYIELEKIYKNAFADTAARPYLVRRAAERGIFPKAATPAILKGVFNIDIPINSRFSLGEVNYKVTEKISTGIYKLECETAGSIGHSSLGSIIPIDFINGLTSAELTEILIPGEDEEDTEVFRQRYFASLDSVAFGGNRADYKDKINNLPGVGGVKTKRAWQGGGTVLATIIDSDFKVPSETLIEAVQTAVDPVTNSAEGFGTAPICHSVTVQGVSETVTAIETNITFQIGYVWLDVKPAVEEAISVYYSELAELWENEEALVVRISQIEVRLLDLPGILDLQNTKINGLGQNLVLDEYAIPKLGIVTNV